MADDGLTSRESQFSVEETIDRLAAGAERAGLMVFARIDHAANAAQIGTPLRPTQLLIFGHPRGGTPLMVDQQTAGIDLPVKALAWQDPDGRVFLTFNDARWMGRRHSLSAQVEDSLAAIEAGIASLAEAATSKDAA
jgi:uncharacterized protein (DUF302 family)